MDSDYPIRTRMREVRSAYKILVGKPQGKRPVGRLEDNIRMDLKHDEFV